MYEAGVCKVAITFLGSPPRRDINSTNINEFFTTRTFLASILNIWLFGSDVSVDLTPTSIHFTLGQHQQTNRTMAAQGLPHEPQDSAAKACETFEHPCFPKLCEESLAESYASSLRSLADHPPFLDLTVGTYDATDLQDATCAGFLSGERYPHQLMAKSAFLKWYSKQFAPRAFDGPPHIDIHLTTSPPSAQRKIFFRDSLREIIRMFDDYFFFGTLTRHRPCYLRPLTFLRMNTLMMEELRSWHPDFTAWWPYDLHGGFFFPNVSFREEDEYRKWRSLPHFGRLNRLIQEDSPEKLVRMEINDRGCLVSVTCTHVWSKTESSKPTSESVPEPTLEPAPEPTPQPTPETTPKSSSGPDSGSTSQDLVAIIDTSKTSKGFRLFIASLFERGQALVTKSKSKRHKKDE
ncbi:hypothetical protein K456DRAFT_39709 [Colletotrichum gloeosporioides 23]|nr:hypothetical protein K456DRAFT_39709 [Colletotrichum gloeosporioides 23]